MNIKLMSRISLGDMSALYYIDDDGIVSFSIVPSGAEAEWKKGRSDSLVQLSLRGDATCPGFAAGATRHNCSSAAEMKYAGQTVTETEGTVSVTTVLRNGKGLEAKHILSRPKSCRCVEIRTEVTNVSGEDIVLEALSSFNLSGITPYADDEATGRLLIHRFRSRWSAEGRPETESAEELQLEPSWSRYGVRCEKFGTLGSMPVRGYFPFAAVEDTGAGVTWAVSLCAAYSWQIELVRADENMSLCGGIADYDFGHWCKVLNKGETYCSPSAYLTAVHGTLDCACERLLDMQREKLLPSQRKKSLPLLFNEFCTTWGNPSEEKTAEMLSVLKGRGYDFFVTDSGWYANESGNWENNMGDWRVSKLQYPNGLRVSVEQAAAAGMKSGLWFEAEIVGAEADAVSDESHLLKRNGYPVISGTRRFWDMRDPWVREDLRKKIICCLKENGFKYIKIDYNDSIGIGCDGSCSLAEGLRENIEATKDFFREIRSEVEGIEIEICSSGGHRLEPSMMELADYLSFSDAHEEKEIPVIAASLQRLVLPQKSQIWAVLREKDSAERLVYSICAGMYGVLCISGDFFKLSREQWETVQRGTDFYKKVSPIIINGSTRKYGAEQSSYRKLRDWQASVRYADDGCSALVIIHTFDIGKEARIELPVLPGFAVDDIYAASDHSIKLEGGTLSAKFVRSFDAAAISLTKAEDTLA